MGRCKKVETTIDRKVLPPATNPESRENRIVSLAYDLVEQRLLDGTATSAETTAVLRLGTMKARLEKEKLEQDIRLSAAKAEAIDSSKHVEELMAEAVDAIRSYQGLNDDEDEDFF